MLIQIPTRDLGWVKLFVCLNPRNIPYLERYVFHFPWMNCSRFHWVKGLIYIYIHLWCTKPYWFVLNFFEYDKDRRHRSRAQANSTEIESHRENYDTDKSDNPETSSESKRNHRVWWMKKLWYFMHIKYIQNQFFQSWEPQKMHNLDTMRALSYFYYCLRVCVLGFGTIM